MQAAADNPGFIVVNGAKYTEILIKDRRQSYLNNDKLNNLKFLIWKTLGTVDLAKRADYWHTVV